MTNKISHYSLGFDVGSTTAKLVVLDTNKTVIYSNYRRHKALIRETVLALLDEVEKQYPSELFTIHFTGSAGMGISEKTKIPFVQEVVAASTVIKTHYPEVKTLIDIGGEDGKIIYFEKDKLPDMRMNGSCAGGTGAFIDQMAVLLNVNVENLNDLAAQATNIYPIASRCGVFAKTDVQNLLSRKISKQDIAASIFNAVAIQTINSLARGVDSKPKVLFSGGPLSFIPLLRKAFYTLLQIDENDCILPQNSALLPAWGAALCHQSNYYTIEQVKQQIKNITTSSKPTINQSILFKSPSEFESWQKGRNISEITRNETFDSNKKYYLGIDCGSTTSKIIIIDENKHILFSKYAHNNGAAIDVIHETFLEIEKKFGSDLQFTASAVTGYGEDLIKAAFQLDSGIVETIAHFTGSKHVDSDVSFILDIGGQDMKAIFIKDGYIQNLEINEACSSGCGSFIENFAHNLNYNAANFAEIACKATSPCDLGTRCTVFMNSKVKQFLREGAPVEDIAAGLAYSVVKNCLYKVLKITDMNVLGNNIVVQGGAFRNKALVRALELETGKQVKCSDIPELMGAFGSALYAMQLTVNPRAISDFSKPLHIHSKQITCKACNNFCVVTRFEFENKGYHFSGNKCEKVFSNKGEQRIKGENIYDFKYDLLFNREMNAVDSKGITIGIPRILGMYENFPFWNTLFTYSGLNVCLSDESNLAINDLGQGTVMADNICFPAKLAHGHIFNLVNKKIDRIFYPIVINESKEQPDAVNSFNCPIVSSYSEVLKSSIPLSKRKGIEIDSPAFSFDDKKLLKKACYSYLKQFNVKSYVFERAFERALFHQNNYKEKIRLRGFRILESARENGLPVIMLVGRPYHTDKLIHQKTSQILTDLGVSVINEEVVPEGFNANFKDLLAISQWSYPNRIIRAAQYVAAHEEYPIEFVHLNSFGCGPDSFFIDEIKDLLQNQKKTYTLLRIDEITSGGSISLRLRSLVESVKQRNTDFIEKSTIKKLPVFGKGDKSKIILAPHFSEVISPMIDSLFQLQGYNFISLPVSDQKTVDVGLKYSNNEICFPATLIVGDLIKALQSGKYDLTNVAVSISQTGGQCRASNYISIIKKALLNAGYENIPVISVATNAGLINEQYGFEIEWKKVFGIAITCVLFADALNKLYFATASRERVKGTTRALYDKYINRTHDIIIKNDKKGMFLLLKQAVDEFNAVDCIEDKLPQIGLVGEIYLKFNNFANMNITQWLIDNRIEVNFPDFLDFIIQEFVNLKVNKKKKLSRLSVTSQLYIAFIENNINNYIKKTDKILKEFRYYQKRHSIYKEAENASKVIDLVHQFGEGWLIPAEIVSFADRGIKNVVSLQPFGCIANHIVSKGIEKRIKDLYPDMNLLFLDFDGGTSEVNIFNRLHFMVENAKETVRGQIAKEEIKTKVSD
ncbi:MAG: 2-hydroxyacyl-CoA dehydratase [Bacteroidales bacterium]|nr:2-hydroxyacyl-CoA dehydratase [Bacteroidales bacterium]